jgi:serine/threonine-protein phosphatase 2A regulatory subunit A
LTVDDQDSVRLLAIENCASISELLNAEDNLQTILPIVKASVEDRSWRVRFSIAKEFFPVSPRTSCVLNI